MSIGNRLKANTPTALRKERGKAMGLIAIFIVWTWGLTPLWVNLAVTIVGVLHFLCELDGFGARR